MYLPSSLRNKPFQVYLKPLLHSLPFLPLGHCSLEFSIYHCKACFYVNTFVLRMHVSLNNIQYRVAGFQTLYIHVKLPPICNLLFSSNDIYFLVFGSLHFPTFTLKCLFWAENPKPEINYFLLTDFCWVNKYSTHKFTQKT